MTIEVKNNKVVINNFETDVSEVVAYFETLKKELEEKKPKEEELQKQLVIELDKLLRLGALAAKAGNVGLSTYFVDKQVEKMKDQEKEHLIYFEKEIQKRKIKPTYLLPLWDIMGVTLGFGTALLGKKAAMLCTASVEEVIEDHYQNQLKKLGNDEMELKAKIEKFMGDEVDHKNMAYEAGATNKGMYSIMGQVIRVGSRIAITISEKI